MSNTMNIKKIFDLTDQVIIITGGAGLLGSEYAKGFSQVGANVVLADQNLAKCKKLAKDLENKFNVSPLAVKLDVTSPDSIKKMVSKVTFSINIGSLELPALSKTDMPIS